MTAADESYVQSMNVGIPNIRIDILREQERFYIPGLSITNSTWPRSSMKLVFRVRTNLTICDVRTEYVESGIQCARDSQNGDLACHANKVRRITLAPELKKYENFTALDVGRNSVIVKYIPYTLASSHPLEPSFLEQWLKNPPTSFIHSYSMDQIWYEDVPLDVFSNRLSMVLNTYLRATLNTSSIFGSDGTSLEGRDATWSNTTGMWTEFTSPVYQLNKVWFSLYIIAAVVLTASASVNLILRVSTLAPDFLGSVSALTRDSMFIQVPTPASTLDCSDRARLLRDTWVMVQDVQPDEKLGRIALSDAEGAVSLHKDRQYM
jgi:hypothetical protein